MKSIYKILLLVAILSAVYLFTSDKGLGKKNEVSNALSVWREGCEAEASRDS